MPEMIDKSWNIAEAEFSVTGTALCACASGVNASFFNQPLQVSVLRPLLHNVLSRALGENEFPQLIFRMGYGSVEQHTPRRTVDEVLL
jgi:hypothetical protein